MTVLQLSLSPEATGRLYETLVCLAKFGESVSIEARNEKLTFTALNLSRTAYAACSFDAATFFLSYDFNALSSTKGGDRFTGQLYNKALQSVFKGRAGDARGREPPIERCDVSIRDKPEKAECRLVIKMFYKHGMTKSYRLTYESVTVMHAIFDKAAATQGWRISSRVLREYIEYFGPKTEQLDLLAQDGKAVFTSFTEKIQDGKEVLKQPLETSITLHTEDFEDFHMQENMHIVISVKDFKAIVTHAETLHGSISAAFSSPTKPMQIFYQHGGVQCEFTLMTTGNHQGGPSAVPVNFVSTRSSSSRMPSQAPAQQTGRDALDMPPPARPNLRSVEEQPLGSQSQHKPLRPQSYTTYTTDSEPDHDSLFMPLDDERRWDPPDFEIGGAEEMLGYDASYDQRQTSPHPTFRDSRTVSRTSRRDEAPSNAASGDQEGLEPTQRLSQLHGMFD